MPNTNSESDFGGSITSDENNNDIEAGPSSPVSGPHLKSQTSKFSIKSQADKHEESHAAGLVSSTVTSKSFLSGPSRMHTTTDTIVGSTGSTLRGAARFRAAARKVMHMWHASSALHAFRGAGAEPGIDPRRPSAIASYGHIRENCAIEVCDYNSFRSKNRKFNNQEFIDFLKANGTEREPWVKVRWICIGGISWDVISTLALQYELHPLSLEDVLHRRGNTRSKADYFTRHLFLRVLCHSLRGFDIDRPKSTRITSLPRSSSPIAFDREDPNMYKAEDERSVSSTSGLLFPPRSQNSDVRKSTPHDIETGSQPGPGVHRSDTQVNAEAQAKIDMLKAGERVDVLLRNLFVFLLRDGTLVSIHQTPTSEFALPIMSRLRGRDTVLRKTADPSLLVHSILDLVVDHAVEVVDEYHKKILKLEHQILYKPDMQSVRSLHILSGDLTLHKRTLGPLKSLVYGLRRYDLDRCVAVAASAAGDSPDGEVGGQKVVGYMSHKAKVYLADVHDHIDHILSTLEMFASVSENLINYTFNMASHEMNEVMRRLTLATIIFLPLTLLTGYFGMNFVPMWSVDNNSDALFWKIAIPVMAVVITSFMWNDIIRAKDFAQKKMALKRVPKMAPH